MTNPISQYGRMAQPEVFSRSGATKTDKQSGTAALTDALNESSLGLASQVAPKKLQEDNILTLSNVAQRVKDEPDFDRNKVEAIKQAINNGQYPLNPRRIAESFVAIEQMIGD
jgi:negative regulator of flagellin synthesis FlgM